VAEPSFPPYNVGDLGGQARRRAPAASRNVEPIGDVLADWLPPSGTVLEVASGTGEHVLAFARRFPGLTFIPSDPDPQAIASIEAWRTEGPDNFRPPLALDVRSGQWPIARADAILSINMVHISPWEASLGLLEGAARLLEADAPLILYGPWRVTGEALAPSNEAFDLDLKRRDARWGLRETGPFMAAAEERGLALQDMRRMPANNLMLLLRRR
jgi:hypothetical protein